MSYLEWTPDLDVGVGEMNDEHKQLIELMNRFHEVAESNAPRADAVKALEELGEFTVKHFRDEEAVMERIGFPGLDPHRRIHKRLLEQLGEHVEKFKQSGQSGELLMFLKVWLKAHIKGIDTKYGAHAASAA